MRSMIVGGAGPFLGGAWHPAPPSRRPQPLVLDSFSTPASALTWTEMCYRQRRIIHEGTWARTQGHQPLKTSEIIFLFFIIHFKLLKDYTLLVYVYWFHKNNNNIINNKSAYTKMTSITPPPQSVRIGLVHAQIDK